MANFKHSLEKPAKLPRRFSWQRRVQYQLRTLLIVTTVLAIWLAWWSHKARQQQAAVAAIGEAGGFVVYSFQTPDRFERRPPYWPEWLVNLVGVDYFGSVQKVGVPNRKLCVYSHVTDASMEQLKGLTRLQGLYLENTDVADAHLKHLQGLTTLENLYLRDTNITDAGLEYLKGLTALKVLDIKGTRVTDRGVARLQDALPKCKISR